MTAKAKAKKKARRKQYIVRFCPNQRDIATLVHLSNKTGLPYSSVIRLALAECGERAGFSLGQDFGTFKDTLHNSQAEESRA